MAKKKDGGKPMMMKEVKIKSTPVKRQTSVTSFGEVPTKRVDSVKKANPQARKLIGKGYTGSGGKTTYGREASDVLKKTLKK